MNKIQLENDTEVSVIWYENLDARSFKQFSQPKWSELVNRLSIPQNNINKYARGVAVYGDIKMVLMKMVKNTKSTVTITM